MKTKHLCVAIQDKTVYNASPHMAVPEHGRQRMLDDGGINCYSILIALLTSRRQRWCGRLQATNNKCSYCMAEEYPVGI